MRIGKACRSATFKSDATKHGSMTGNHVAIQNINCLPCPMTALGLRVTIILLLLQLLAESAHTQQQWAACH